MERAEVRHQSGAARGDQPLVDEIVARERRRLGRPRGDDEATRVHPRHPRAHPFVLGEQRRVGPLQGGEVVGPAKPRQPGGAEGEGGCREHRQERALAAHRLEQTAESVGEGAMEGHGQRLAGNQRRQEPPRRRQRAEDARGGEERHLPHAGEGGPGQAGEAAQRGEGAEQ